MHSFRQSRSRILFEVFCALAVSASFVGAWTQTGASALLPAAVAAGLYAIVHTFDLRRRNDVSSVEPQVIDVVAVEQQGDLLSRLETGKQEPAANDEPVVAGPAVVAEQVEPAAPRASRGSRAKAQRKGSARRASAPDEEMVTEAAPPEEAEVVVPEHSDEPAYTPLAPLAPLFEPEPFVRQHRAAFGRKAG